MCRRLVIFSPTLYSMGLMPSAMSTRKGAEAARIHHTRRTQPCSATAKCTCCLKVAWLTWLMFVGSCVRWEIRPKRNER